MTIKRQSLVLAVEEHLLSGNPITRVESLILFGVPNLPAVVSDLRKKGWKIELRTISYARAIVRINQHAVLVPPKSLPVRDIQITEYQIKR